MTYNKPRRKIPVRPILVVVDICSFQTIGMGMIRIMRSVRTSEMTKARLSALVLSQYFSIVAALVHQWTISVWHWKANAKKNDSDHRMITAHMARE